MIHCHTLEPPHDLCKSAVDVALNKLGRTADFYIIVCHESCNWIAKKIKEVLKKDEGIEMRIVLRTDNDRFSWYLNACNNAGPPFVTASCHSAMTA